MESETNDSYELTKIQKKFINTILHAISMDKELCQFVVCGGTGTSFTLKRLDEILEKGAMSFVIHKEPPVIIKEDGNL